MSFHESPKNWEPPDGLGYSSLRPVRLTGQGIALAVIAAIFLVGAPVLGVVIATQSKNAGERKTLLQEQGVDTTAVITRVWRSGGEDNTHMVSYRFAAGEGKVSAPSGIWRGLVAGAPIAVRYLPTRPEINHPVDWEARQAPFFLAYAVSIPMLILPAIFVVMIRKQMRLLSEGRPAPGVVTDVKRSDKAVIVKYEFRLMSGAVMKGRSGGSRKQPAVGSTCCVIYDPENPKRNAVYPLPLVKLVR